MPSMDLDGFEMMESIFPPQAPSPTPSTTARPLTPVSKPAYSFSPFRVQRGLFPPHRSSVFGNPQSPPAPTMDPRQTSEGPFDPPADVSVAMNVDDRNEIQLSGGLRIRNVVPMGGESSGLSSSTQGRQEEPAIRVVRAAQRSVVESKEASPESEDGMQEGPAIVKGSEEGSDDDEKKVESADVEMGKESDDEKDGNQMDVSVDQKEEEGSDEEGSDEEKGPSKEEKGKGKEVTTTDEDELDEEAESRSVTPPPNEQQPTLDQVMNQNFNTLRYEEANAEVATLLLPDMVTIQGMTSSQATYILGTFLAMPEMKRNMIFALGQEKFGEGLNSLVTTNKKRKDTDHIKSPQRKRIRRHSSSSSPLSSSSSSSSSNVTD